MKSALLLEDNPDRARHIKIALNEAGYVVTWARTVAEAQRAWAVHQFDLATLDHDLGESGEDAGSGSEFTRWLIGQQDVDHTVFLVHSFNPDRGKGMLADLSASGCVVARVLPKQIGMVAAQISAQLDALAMSDN